MNMKEKAEKDSYGQMSWYAVKIIDCFCLCQKINKKTFMHFRW